MMKTSRFFKLIKKKHMKDGHFIESNQKLLYICSEDKKIKVKTIDDSDIVRIFWVDENEVVFSEEVVEEWSKEKLEIYEKEINGNWI